MPTLSDNKQQFVINADSIFLNNNNDKHNSHIPIFTKGDVNENDVEFKTCNVKVVDGDFSTKRIKDLAGNAVIDINTNAIDFKNTPISNLNLGSGSVAADTVASSNGYASLDLELDAHLALINGKVSQNGHTANKIFISSNGGAFTTTGNCTPSDLSKIATGGAVDSNTAKTSFPGFGTSAGTSLEGDTTTITGAQASAITANTAKVSFPGFGSSAGTALEGDTTTISGAQASAITANTAKTSFPGFGTSAGTALEGDTTTISGAQASAITANTAKTSFPGFGTTAGTSLEGNTTTISGSQASAITANTAKTSFPGFGTTAGTALEGNTTTISSSQATAISTNTSNISTNTSNISTNTTDITAVNAGRVANANAIAINSGNISTNSTNISTNTSNISTNTSNISTNTSKTSILTKSGNKMGVNISPIKDLHIHNPDTSNGNKETTLRLTNHHSISNGSATFSGLELYSMNSNTGATSCGLLNHEDCSILITQFGAGNNGQMIMDTNGNYEFNCGTLSSSEYKVSGHKGTDFVVENSTSGRARMKLLSINDQPNDLIFGSNNAEKWFLSGRNSSSNYDLIFFSYNGSSYNDVMTLDWTDGRVGIGTTTPAAPLHVYGNPYAANGVNIQTYIRPTSTSMGGPFSAWTGNSIYGVSIMAEYSIFSKYGYVGASDERIKENIIEVDDNSALKKVRDISCCWYNYKDKVEKGDDKVLGFIAQQVKEHLPEAVGRIKSIIPNIMKLINTTWNGTKMSSSDLQDVSGIKYRFYVSNDISDNEKMVELVGDENNCFNFDEKWENVFCYGKEVDDFHTLDKQKLFALNFSATQELDRLVAKLIDRVNDLEAKLAEKESN